MEDVRAAIEAANANRPKGLVEGANGRSWQIYTNAAGKSAADYRPLVVAWRDAAAVRLGDIATVTDSVATRARWGCSTASARSSSTSRSSRART